MSLDVHRKPRIIFAGQGGSSFVAKIFRARACALEHRPAVEYCEGRKTEKSILESHGRIDIFERLSTRLVRVAVLLGQMVSVVSCRFRWDGDERRSHDDKVYEALHDQLRTHLLRGIALILVVLPENDPLSALNIERWTHCPSPAFLGGSSIQWSSRESVPHVSYPDSLNEVFTTVASQTGQVQI